MIGLVERCAPNILIVFGLCIPTFAFYAHAFADQSSSIENGALIYAKECASCHGGNLEGQNDWMSQNEDGTMRAPPHDDTGHTWHHPDEFLFNYTKFGGAEMLKRLGLKDVKSGMPAYSNRLNDQEIWDVLDYIKSNWSEKSRKYQKRRTKQSNG